MILRLVTLVVAVLAFACVAHAQGPEPADPGTTPFDWYGSKAGVIAMTIFVVSILKRALGGVSALNSIPTWLYAVVVSGALTFLVVQVWGTLPGNVWQTMSETVLSAAAASGIYEWINNGTKSLAASARSARSKGASVTPRTS